MTSHAYGLDWLDKSDYQDDNGWSERAAMWMIFLMIATAIAAAKAMHHGSIAHPRHDPLNHLMDAVVIEATEYYFNKCLIV